MSKIKLIFFFILTSNNLYTSDVKTAFWYYNNSNELFVQGEYYNAIDSLLEAIRINPNYYDAYKFIAKIYYKLKIYDQALLFIEKAYRMSGKDFEYDVLYADILFKNNKLNEARDFYSKILLSQKNNLSALLGIANIYEREGLLVAAANYYIEILNYYPKNYEAFSRLLKIYKELNMNDKAKQLIVKSKGLLEEEPIFYKEIALFYLHLKDYKSAREYSNLYLKLLESFYKDLNLIDAYELLINIYLKEENYNEAIEYIKDAILIDMNSQKLYYLLGYSYLKIQDYENALINLERAYKLNSNLSFFKLALEDTFLVSNLSNTKRDLNKAMSQDYMREAENDLRSLKIDLALDNIKNGLEIFPENDELRFLLAKVYKLLSLNTLSYEQLYYLVNKKESKDKDLLDFYDVVKEYVRKNLFVDYGFKNIDDLNQVYDSIEPYKIGFFTMKEADLHGSNEIIIRSAERYLDRNNFIEVVNYDWDYSLKKPYLVDFFSQMFSYAREENLDLFFMFYLTPEIEENRLNVKLEAYSGYTGNKLKEFTYVTTGFNYLNSFLKSFSKDLLNFLRKKGKIIKINNKDIVINLGSMHGIKKGSQITILKNDLVNSINSLKSFNNEDVVGTVIIENVSDYVSKGYLKSTYLLKDYVQVGRQVLFIENED